MKKLTAYSLQLIALIMFLGYGPSYAEVVDKIAIVVNNEIITQREIDKALQPIYEEYRALYYGDELVKKMEEARRGVVAQLIEDKLVLSEAKKENIEVDEREVEDRIGEARSHFPTREIFENALLEEGISLKDLKQRYKEQIMVRRLIDQKIGSRIVISPVEMANYYKEHINEYIQPEGIKLRNILIRPKDDLSADKALAQAQGILKKIKDGGDFAELAREYSDGPYAKEGGLMGYVKRGDLLPEIEGVVFDLKEGEVSGVIQTALGYHIFKVEEKRPRRTRELSEVRHEVEGAIFREKIREKLKGWLENLKKNAYIAFK